MGFRWCKREEERVGGDWCEFIVDASTMVICSITRLEEI